MNDMNRSRAVSPREAVHVVVPNVFNNKKIYSSVGLHTHTAGYHLTIG
ncbi:hypothetical protein [Caballeronia sp. LZ001]|nr:hypothetical protein [Caballeronia sp. LZ001]MDR5800933.1 hypothetical protein [Caballeronia sp. LZ001]